MAIHLYSRLKIMAISQFQPSSRLYVFCEVLELSYGYTMERYI